MRSQLEILLASQGLSAIFTALIEIADDYAKHEPNELKADAWETDAQTLRNARVLICSDLPFDGHED